MLKPYPIVHPAIASGNIYKFYTKHDIEYEVRFGRKEDNILHVNIVFGVTNEEYEGEEYVLTNKNDVFRVMVTIARIVEIYKALHPNVQVYEFTAEPVEKEKSEGMKRMKLYSRYLPLVFDKSWKMVRKQNNVLLVRNK